MWYSTQREIIYFNMIFFFFTTSEKKELRKSFWPFFGPFWQIFDKNSAANLLSRTYFLPAPFELCCRKFGQLATLIYNREARVSPKEPWSVQEERECICEKYILSSMICLRKKLILINLTCPAMRKSF